MPHNFDFTRILSRDKPLQIALDVVFLIQKSKIILGQYANL
jgi:hypothetical protein